MPKTLFTDKKTLSRKTFNKVLSQEEDIRNFVDSLTEHAKYVNKERQNYKRDKQSRRLDAFARLLVADEICSAVSFDGEKLVIASNNNKHSKDLIEAKQETYVKAGSTKSEITIFHNINITIKLFGDKDREIQLSAKGKEIKCRFVKTLEGSEEIFEIINDDDLKVKVQFDLSSYNIVFLPNISMPIKLNKKFSLHTSFNNQALEKDQLIDGNTVNFFNSNIPLDPLTRRAKKLTEYLAIHTAYSRHKKLIDGFKEFHKKHPEKATVSAEIIKNEFDKKKELFDKYIKMSDHKRYELLKDSLVYEAGHLYGIKIFNDKDKEQNRYNTSDYKNSKKKTFDDFISLINNNFNEFKKDKIGRISQIVDDWIAKLTDEITKGTVDAPEYIKKDLNKFFKISRRYFIDLEKLKQFIEEDVEKEGALSKIWGDDWDHSKVKHSFKIIDEADNDTHAELKLLLYYLNKKEKNIPYIATSILCCGMCNLVMDAFNINVSGTHANIYPWHLDKEFKDKLKDILPHEIYNRFLEILCSKNQIITTDGQKHIKSDVLYQMIETLAYNIPGQEANHQPADDSDDEGYAPIERPRYLQEIIFNKIESELCSQINQQNDKQCYTFKFDKKHFNSKNLSQYFKSKIDSFNEIETNNDTFIIRLDKEMFDNLNLHNSSKNLNIPAL